MLSVKSSLFRHITVYKVPAQSFINCTGKVGNSPNSSGKNKVVLLLLPQVPGSASRTELVVGIRRLDQEPLHMKLQMLEARLRKRRSGGIEAAWYQCRRCVRAEGG